MAVDKITDPLAEAIVSWRTTEDGGRSSGPPTAPVYTGVAIFTLGGEAEVQPDWPRTADPMVTAWVERIEERSDGTWLCLIDFPAAPHLAAPYVATGNEFLLLEGTRIVASATFTKVYPRMKDS